MMNNRTENHRRWRRRAVTVIGLGVVTVAAIAVPAIAHPVFSNDPPGFPNPQGSNAIPYPAGSRPTMNMFLPFEQDGVTFNGADNTTVDVQVTVPDGWSNPGCGTARTSPSVGYRQVGAVVPGWTCTIEAADSHQVLHWKGPQVGHSEDSAQFFTFQVTVPSPATQTSYGTTGGPEGFYVEQRYASHTAATCSATDNDCSLWRTPNSTRPGEVANGIVRAVAATTPRDPNQPPPSELPVSHTGPNPSRPKPPAVTPPGAKPPGSPPPNQSGGGPVPPPAGAPSPSEPPTATPAPSGAAQDSLPVESSPGADPADPQSASAVEQQATQQRALATDRSRSWQIVVGVVLAAALVAGGVIVVVKRRRRVS